MLQWLLKGVSSLSNSSKKNTLTDEKRDSKINLVEPDSATENQVIQELLQLKDVPDFCQYWNYPCEQHQATTPDGYILGLFRIPNAKGGSTAFYAEKPYHLPTVVLMHGVGLSSDVFVCHVSPELNLAFVLADAGFDVWLANVRGNKYSLEHEHQNSKQDYWDFNVDEMALLDIPCIVDYILERTGRTHLSWLGYSQGSASVCAALSVNDELGSKINLVVGIGSALKPRVLSNPVFDILYRMGLFESFLDTITGHTAPFPSGIIDSLNRNLPYSMKSPLMDKALQHVFGWETHRFGNEERKKVLYSSLISTTSSHVIKHWHHIMHHGFTMKTRHCKLVTTTRSHYRTVSSCSSSRALIQLNNSLSPPSISTSSSSSSLLGRWMTRPWRSCHPSNHHTLRYPINHIKTDIHFYYGSRDPTSDPDYFKTHLPANHTLYEIEGYNHLDFIFAQDAKERVWDQVIQLLHSYYPLNNSKQQESDSDEEKEEKGQEEIEKKEEIKDATHPLATYPTWPSSHLYSHSSPQRILLSQQQRPMGMARKPSLVFGPSQDVQRVGVRRIPSIGKKEKETLVETFQDHPLLF